MVMRIEQEENKNKRSGNGKREKVDNIKRNIKNR